MADARPPVIVIGMHRSGTTLLTDLLQGLGLHLGWVQQENSEALFFVERNEALLLANGGSWEHPEPVDRLLAHTAMRAAAVRQLHRDVESWRFLSYLGPARARSCGSLGRLDFAWGWKDPRNSFLLPLWLDLVPEARIVHVCRHPLDVARSLRQREGRALEQRLARIDGRGVARDNGVGNASFRSERGLLYAYRRVSALRSRFAPLGRYDRLFVPATGSLDAGLDLWTRYVGRCLEHTDRLADRAITVRFEDFVARPLESLERLAAFCGLEAPRETVTRLCARIRPERRYAFVGDASASSTFEPYRNHPVLRRLAYDVEYRTSGAGPTP